MTDFIEVYPGVLDPPTCQRIIEQFEASGQATRGQTGSGVDTALKDSYDITISGRTDWQEVEALSQRAAFAGLARYVRKYPFLMIGPLALRWQDAATGAVRLIDETNFAAVPEAQYHRMLGAVFRPGTIN